MSQIVSIIIPCYNSELFISETLDSIVMQNYTNIEVIVVNDGSTDKSVNIIESFKTKLNLSVIHQENEGVSSARNNGFKISNGEFIMFLDADDILEPHFINERVDFFKKNKEVNCLGSRILVFDSYSKNIIRENYSIISDIKANVLSYVPFTSTVPSSYMFRRLVFSDDSELFNVKLQSTADRFFIIKYSDVITANNITSNDASLLYRIHEESMSNKLNAKLVDDNALFYDDLLRSNFISERIHLIKGYQVLYKSYFKIKNYRKSILYFVKLVCQFLLKLIKPKMVVKEL